MSRTIILGITPGGDLCDVEEFYNSYGSAMYVWRSLVERYIDPDASRWMIRNDTDMQPLWNLIIDKRIPEPHRWVLASTFDGAVVHREDFGLLAMYYNQFVDDYPPKGVCTLREQAHTLIQMGDVDYRGACWIQTSVADDWWYVYDDQDEHRWLNVDTDPRTECGRDRWWLLFGRDAL